MFGPLTGSDSGLILKQRLLYTFCRAVQREKSIHSNASHRKEPEYARRLTEPTSVIPKFKWSQRSTVFVFGIVFIIN
jgi:hypothetical protein